MMRRLALILLLAAISAVGMAQGNAWESANINTAPEVIKAAQRQPDLDAPETAVNDRGELFLLMPRRDTVKVFTILGQPISSSTVEAGVWRMNIKKRGIYIIKIGSVTRRVVI